MIKIGSNQNINRNNDVNELPYFILNFLKQVRVIIGLSQSEITCPPFSINLFVKKRLFHIDLDYFVF